VANRLQYRSQAAATGYSCVMCKLCQNGGRFYGWATIQTFKEAESSVLEFKVVGQYRVTK